MLDSGEVPVLGDEPTTKTYYVGSRTITTARTPLPPATWAVDSKDEVLGARRDICLEHGVHIETAPPQACGAVQTFFLYVYEARRQPREFDQRRRAADAGRPTGSRSCGLRPSGSKDKAWGLKTTTRSTRMELRRSSQYTGPTKIRLRG